MSSFEPKHFINRELSWLRFNSRVLEEASNTRNPPLEQLKYIAIYGTNLDEFYMIRVAGLKELKKARITPSSADGLSVYDQLNEIRRYISNELVVLEKRIKELFVELDSRGLRIKEYSQLTAQQKRKATAYFTSGIYPVIIPIAVDTKHPFPHLNNLSFGMVIKLKEEDEEPERFGLVRLPRILPRFIEIDSNTFVPIESIVINHIQELFSGFTPISYASFRVTRNADISIEEEEADDFLEVLEEGLRMRKKGDIVRLEISANDDPNLLAFLTSHLTVSKNDTYIRTTPMNLGSYWELVNNKRFGHLLLRSETPRVLPPFDTNEPIMTTIEKQDVMLLAPYESFSPVERFIKEAANDPNVLAIRMTLYRVGANSPLVKALIEAAEEGKMVMVVVELKARFDEANNLRWAKALEAAGAHVIYGVVGLKVHAKMAHVIRREMDGSLKHFVHLSTGNYNAQSARIYTDVSLFSANQKIGNDAVRFFHHISGFAKNTVLDELSMAPIQIKPKLLELIRGEIAQKTSGEIILKMNALVDKDIIQELYKASQAGVKVELIVRGICTLRPKLTGVSDNIRVISIVGKYLEHARVFYFKHSTPSIYFASLDAMPRNLLRRVELMTPVYDSENAKVLLMLLRLQLNDTKQARELLATGEYIKATSSAKTYDSQSVLEDVVFKAYKKGENDSLAVMLAKELGKLEIR